MTRGVWNPITSDSESIHHTVIIDRRAPVTPVMMIITGGDR